MRASTDTHTNNQKGKVWKSPQKSTKQALSEFQKYMMASMWAAAHKHSESGLWKVGRISWTGGVRKSEQQERALQAKRDQHSTTTETTECLCTSKRTQKQKEAVSTGTSGTQRHSGQSSSRVYTMITSSWGYSLYFVFRLNNFIFRGGETTNIS